MRLRTFLGILVALSLVVSVSYISNQNQDLLTLRFQLTPTRSIPVYMALLWVFLAGFLPAVSALLVQTLKQDLAQRQGRKRSREARSLKGSSRRALDYQADGQWGKALDELKALLADQEDDFATLMQYGEVLRRVGQTDEAIEVHRRASVLYPQSVAVLYQLARDYEARGEPEVSDQIRERILRDFKGQGLRELRRRRNMAMDKSDWKVATRLQDKIDALLASESGDEVSREGEFRIGLTYQRGVEYLKSGRLDEAEERFSEILEKEPRFIPALIMLGEARLLRDQEQGALAVWKGGFEGTGSPTLLQRIEDYFIEKGLPREAIETLHELIGSAENDLLPRFFLGRLFYRLEMHDEAFKVLDGLHDRIQNSPTYHYLLARIHERRGEMHKAVGSYSASAHEAGIAVAEYICSTCHESYKNWEARCDKCGAWNSIDLDFKEEKISAEDLGVKPAAVWAGPEDLLDSESL